LKDEFHGDKVPKYRLKSRQKSRGEEQVDKNVSFLCSVQNDKDADPSP
jgi:hypothetical protein